MINYYRKMKNILIINVELLQKYLIMESKPSNSISSNMSSIIDSVYNLPSQLTGGCAECEFINNLTYCGRCRAAFCNFHILPHCDYKTCVSCNKDTCVAMMGLLLGKPTDKCFHCETGNILTMLKHLSDELYDDSKEKGLLNAKIIQHNIDVNSLYNAKYYGSPFAGKF